MAALLRDTTFGVLIRWATKRKYLKYPEEQPSFHCQNVYLNGGQVDAAVPPGIGAINYPGEGVENDGRSHSVVPPSVD